MRILYCSFIVLRGHSEKGEYCTVLLLFYGDILSRENIVLFRYILFYGDILSWENIALFRYSLQGHSRQGEYCTVLLLFDGDILRRELKINHCSIIAYCSFIVIRGYHF